MSSLFCCESIKPHRPQRLSHEPKFDSFMSWAAHAPASSSPVGDTNLDAEKNPFVVQLVRQVNYGPLESKRYFASATGHDAPFVEVTENALIDANYRKLNAFKNFKCATHNKFFEMNLYEKDPVNKHHWRADLARPAGSIDL